MKILQILTELEPGGAEKVALDLAGEFIRKGHTAALAVLKTKPLNPTLEKKFLDLGIRPFYLNMQGPFSVFTAVFKLRTLIRNFQPDVVHAHLIHPNLLSRFASLFLKTKLVNTIHISERRSGRTFYFLADGLTIRLCDLCTAVSSATARFHEKKAFLKKNSIKTVYNGVDPVKPLTDSEKEELRIQWCVKNCSKVIGCVGRLDPQKGFDLLIRSLKTLSPKIPQGETWGLVIIGEGSERKHLEELAGSQIPENILFRMPGFSPVAARQMDAFDLFVMPSRYEGYGLVLAEAMSLGLPCAVSNVDSLPELCRDYSSAVLTDFNQPAAAAEAIFHAMTLPRLKPRIICTRKKMADAYLKLYRG